MAPKVFIYTECKLYTKVHIFIWGGLRGGTRLFLGWLQPPHATPVEPPLPPCRIQTLSLTVSVTQTDTEEDSPAPAAGGAASKDRLVDI